MKVNSIGVNTGYFNQKQNNKAKQNTIQSQVSFWEDMRKIRCIVEQSKGLFHLHTIQKS